MYWYVIDTIILLYICRARDNSSVVLCTYYYIFRYLITKHFIQYPCVIIICYLWGLSKKKNI